MSQFIVRRVLIAIPTAFLVSLFAFGVVHLVPGDVILLQLQDTGRVTAEQYAEMARKLGLDRPAWVQFGSWMGGVLRGDLGQSLWTGRDVTGEIARTLPLTLQLGLMSMAFAIAISVPVGILSAVRQNTPWDYLGRGVAIFGLSVPDFAVAMALILVLSLTVQWVPPMRYTPFLTDPRANLSQML